MKAVIYRKLYDTDTATLLATWENSYHPTNSKHIYEALYQKKNGEYFLYGVGGPLTRYCKSGTGHGYSNGEKITPLSIEAAKDWVEIHANADTYVKCFGNVEEQGISKQKNSPDVLSDLTPGE